MDDLVAKINLSLRNGAYNFLIGKTHLEQRMPVLKVMNDVSGIINNVLDHVNNEVYGG